MQKNNPCKLDLFLMTGTRSVEIQQVLYKNSHISQPFGDHTKHLHVCHAFIIKTGSVDQDKRATVLAMKDLDRPNACRAMPQPMADISAVLTSSLFDELHLD